jgi:hypothetical protein
MEKNATQQLLIKMEDVHMVHIGMDLYAQVILIHVHKELNGQAIIVKQFKKDVNLVCIGLDQIVL